MAVHTHISAPQIARFRILIYLMCLLAACCIAEPEEPDAMSCNPILGEGLKRSPCEAALANLPRGALPSIFTTRQSEPRNNWNQVPVRRVDSDHNPECSITIDLDGHSQNDVFVLVPWDKIRAMAQDVIGICVDGFSWGGWETYGLNATFEALMPPAPYHAIPPPDPATVVNPDGSEDSSSVAMPEGYGGRHGFNVPLYMVVTVAGPRSRQNRDEMDYVIGLSLTEHLKERMESANTAARKNEIARTATAFDQQFAENLFHAVHPRWYEFKMGPVNPKPINVKYRCDASLGKPSTANCENVLYDFTESGPVVLDPASGPLIKTSGNCAIGVQTKSKLTTTWEMLRTVAEGLVVSCIEDPVLGTRGGFATSQPVLGRKRQADPNAWPSSLTMAAYFQDHFNGPASDTCAWDAVSQGGDVRQCPAWTGPWRPPERKLSANGTSFHELHGGNITVIQNGDWTEVTKGNLTTTIHDLNLTSVLADLPMISALPSPDSANPPTA